MVESRGGRFIRGKVTSVNPEDKIMLLDTGDKISYDLVSFNVGSHLPLNILPGAGDSAYPVKPIEKLEALRSEILQRITDGTPHIVIIGAGPAGVELAGNIWRLVKEHRGSARITLASSRDGVLPRLPARVGALARASLERRGIAILSDFRAASIEEGLVHSHSGRTVPFDIAIVSIGIVPNGIFWDSGLDTATDGSLLVNDYLQSVTHADVFGGGDCITIRNRKIDRVGVYAVREAPILFHNILARLRREPLKPFVPQHHYLLIFNFGDGTGLLFRRPFTITGKWAFSLKDYIDRRFMKRFQVSGETRSVEEE